MAQFTEWDVEQIKRYCEGGNKNSGYLVTTKTGLKGRTYSHEGLINGKVRVYVDEGKFLCNPDTLILNGFID